MLNKEKNDLLNSLNILNVNPSKENPKKKTIKLLLEIALFTLGTLLVTACSPAKAEGSNEFLTATPSVTATLKLTSSPSPTPSLSPTVEPAPIMSLEEIISKLNITNTDPVCITSIVVFECTLRDGKKVKFLTCLFRSVEENGDYTMTHKNVFDNEPFATFVVKKEELDDPEKQVKNGNDQERFDIKLIPEFLSFAKIDAMYSLCDIPYIYGERGENIPDNPLLNLIVERMAYIQKLFEDPKNAEDPKILEEADNDIIFSTFPSMKEIAEVYAAICKPNEMVLASDYIKDFQPTVGQKTPSPK